MINKTKDVSDKAEVVCNSLMFLKIIRIYIYKHTSIVVFGYNRRNRIKNFELNNFESIEIISHVKTEFS